MSELLKKNCVVFDIDAENKETVIQKMVKELEKAGKIGDAQKFYDDVLAREAISPTFIGFDLGMPHGKTSNVLEAGICFGRLKQPVIWEPETGDTAEMIVMIAVPEVEAGNTHLDILAKLSRNMMHEDFREKLKTSDQEAVYRILTTILEGK